MKIESKSKVSIGPYNKSLAIFNECLNFPFTLPKTKQSDVEKNATLTIYASVPQSKPQSIGSCTFNLMPYLTKASSKKGSEELTLKIENTTDKSAYMEIELSIDGKYQGGRMGQRHWTLMTEGNIWMYSIEKNLARETQGSKTEFTRTTPQKIKPLLTSSSKRTLDTTHKKDSLVRASTTNFANSEGGILMTKKKPNSILEEHKTPKLEQVNADEDSLSPPKKDLAKKGYSKQNDKLRLLVDKVL